MYVLTVDYTSPTASQDFCRSLKETGFAVLTNCPVSKDLISEAYKQWAQFFNLDEAAKNEFLHPKNAQDGYFPFLTESAKDASVGDLKEFYHFYPWGQVPGQVSDISFKIFNELSGLSHQLLGWIEDYLPREVSSQLSMPLNTMIDHSKNTLLRILHYPPLQADREAEAVRAAPHEDINLITLLPAATAPGLEVMDVKGNWHSVACDPGNIVVNVGDMLQMCTQYYYKSTTHRVVNPPSDKEHSSRYSMPLFLHPREDVHLSTEYTAIEYLNERLRQIGIYK